MSTPAPLTSEVVGGLAVTRRRPARLDPGSPAVILVHGAMDRAASFGRTMRRLGDMDVVAYDRRGYGASNAAGVAARVVDHADDLRGIARWTGASSVVVVGHSLGGTIAMALAMEGASPVTGIAAFESPFPLLDDSFDQVGGGAVQIGETEGAAAGAEHFYRLMVGETTWDRLRERDRAARRAEGAALMAELTDLRDRDHAIDPALVTVPVLVGMGGLSSTSLRASATALAARVGHVAPDVIDQAGHGAHLTHPDEFARLCRRAVMHSSVPRSDRSESLP